MSESKLSVWLEFALQQMAAESYLDGITLSNDADIITRLKLGNNNPLFNDPNNPILSGKTRFVDLNGVPNANQITGSAQAFVARYEIVDHHANDAMGFSATLMRDRTTGEYTLSFRSTEFRTQTNGGDRDRDGFGADLEITTDGFAFGQLVAMEAYYQQLKTDPTKLPPGAVLNVTGYSLGGHLATVFTELHANEVNHTYVFNGAGRGHITGAGATEAERVQGMLSLFRNVLFNPDAGLSVIADQGNPRYQGAAMLTGQPFSPFTSETTLGGAGNLYTDARYRWALEVATTAYDTDGVSGAPGEVGTSPAFAKITQLYGLATTGDLTVVANSGVHAPATPVFIEGQPLIEGVPLFQDQADFGNTHALTLLVDSLAAQELIQTIDSRYGQASAELLMRASSNSRADSVALLNTPDVAEGDSLEKTVDAFRTLFLGPTLSAPNSLPVDSRVGGFGNLANRNDMYAAMGAIEQAVQAKQAQGVLFTIEDLTSPTVSSPALAGIADTDTEQGLAYRYALKVLNPFAIVANTSQANDALYQAHNDQGQLIRVNPTDGTGTLTTQYLTDRALFLKEKIALNQLDKDKSSGAIHFKDFTSNGLEITTTPSLRADREFFFGSDGLDTLTGGSKDDHLYGGDSVDVLIGNAGRDYLEGNGGSDRLEGGTGADTLVGGSGNDTYLVDDLGDQVIEVGDNGTDSVESSVTFSLAGTTIETLTLTGTDDLNGTGNELNNLIIGNDGVNRLVGGAGQDTLQGGIGNDVLAGGIGTNDLLEGGAGFDTYIYNIGDGAHQIEDSDATGRILFNGSLLQGGISTNGGISYVSLDGNTTYVLSGGHLIVNGALTVNADFQSGQFGIELRDVSEANYDNGLPTNTFTGMAGDDTIATGGVAGTRNAIVNAGAGNDYVLASANNDLLFGEAGNDQMYGNSGDDRLYGGSENDLLVGDNAAVLTEPDGNDLVDGGDGADTLLGGFGHDVLSGGEGNDVLWGDYDAIYAGKDPGPLSLGDYLDGGAGDDELHGGEGSDVLSGGTGNDFLSGEAGDDVEDGGAGDDLILAYTGNDSLAGGVGLDTLYGDQEDDILDGGDDADTLHGGDGADDLYGGAGDDLLFGDGLNNPSELSAAGGADFLDGGADNDHLEGGLGDDMVFGGTGNDVLFGQAGADSLFGDDGADELQGGAGNDLLAGDAGNDRLFGQEGDDVLLGDVGDDLLNGDVGNDQLLGGTGNDMLLGQAGDDAVFGDGGDDDLQSGEGNDSLEGGGGADTLAGGSGADTYVFNLGDGIDSIIDAPGQGNRVVFGPGVSAEDISLGIGSLLVRVGSNGDAIHIEGFNPSNPIQPAGIDLFEFADGTTLTHAELVARGFELVGTNGDDFLDGGDTYQKIIGLGGNDQLIGGIDDNLLDGGEGTDRLFAGAGADRLLGGAGNDWLDGGEGTDQLDGGAGDDRLEGGIGDDTYQFSLGGGFDQIVESSGPGDANLVVFGLGIDSAGLQYRLGNGLEIPIGTEGDGLSLGFPNFSDIYNSRAVDQFQFADGTTLTHAQMVDRGIEIPGTESDDVLFGTNARDLFTGGLGNDQLFGDAGNDRYVFNVGDGVDSISDTASPGEGDEVAFGPSIFSGDLTLGWQAPQFGIGTNKLLVRVGASGDALLLDSFDRSDVLGTHAVDSYQFSDGTALTYSQLIARGFDLNGTDGNDVVAGTNVTDRLKGLAGQDTLQGGDGDDVLDGGIGNDLLNGGRGDDIYLLGRGSGQDRLIDLGGTQDAIHYAADVAPGDVQVTKNGKDMVLTIGDAGDAVILSQFFTASVLQIDAVRFADGTVWDSAVLAGFAQRPILGTTGADTLTGTAGDDALQGLAGNDHLSGLAGNDVLDGGVGADTMAGGQGDDTYIVDDGADIVMEATGEGLDSIQSSVTRQLTANVENLALVGTAVIDGTGNALDNVLTGNSAANVLTGGAGDDTYVIDGDDTVVEQAGEGVDTIVTGQAYTLGANLENLTLAGSAPIDGAGNDLDNVLTGNSAVNVLAGGKGNDTYVVSAGDLVVEQAGEGIDTIQTTRSYRLGANVENVTLLETARRVDQFSQLGPNADDATATSIYGGTAAGLQVGIGNELDNVLLGNDQRNVLEGDVGNDTLAGNGGLDVLRGGMGQDTYLFGFGSGIDVIDDMNTGEIDTIQLEAGISPDQVMVTRQQILTDSPIYGLFPFGFALSLALPNPDRNAGAPVDQTYIIYNTLDDFSTKQVRFADGTVWDDATLLDKSVGESNPGPGITLDGGSGDDLIVGSAANDRLNGFDGNDRLEGGAGNDILDGGSGNDVLLGGDGRDALSGGEGDNELDGGGGSDNLSAAGGQNILKGGPGSDFLGGQGVSNVLDGGTGDDNLFGLGTDTFVFGRGYDYDSANPGSEDIVRMTSDVLPADVLLYSIESGNHRLGIRGTSDELQMGSSFPGQVIFADGTVWDQAYLISHEQQGLGTDGNDTMRGTNSAETMVGGKGDDLYRVGDGDVVVELPNEGNDTITTLLDYALPENVENLIFNLNSQAVLGIGNELANVIMGTPDHGSGDGDNILDGSAGNDVLIGGASIPSFTETGDGSDLLIGGPGSDVLRPFFWMSGGPPFSSLGAHGADVLLGGPGNDTYILIGGYEVRSAVDPTQGPFFDLLNATVVELPGEGSDTVIAITDQALPSNIENLFLFGGTHGVGNELDNVLIGSIDANVFEGLAGDDTLIGGYGQVLSRNGFDFVDPATLLDDSINDSAVDRLAGGVGDDVYVVGVGDIIVESSGEGTDRVVSRLSYQLGNHLEHLMLAGDEAIDGTGNVLDNTLTGNRAANVLAGGLGDDVLLGGGGDDTYLFNLGDGIDTIEDTASAVEGNRIRLGSGITQGDLTFTQDDVARTLTIQVGRSGIDQLLLKNFDPAGTNGSLVVKTLAFADGSTTDLASLFGGSTNHAPTVAQPLGDQTVPEDASFSLAVPANTFADPDAGDHLTLRASLADGSALPGWLSFDPNTQTFAATPDDAQVGTLDVLVTATDTGNLSAADAFTLTVQNVNEVPTVANPLANQTTLEDASFSFAVPITTFVDEDEIHGDRLTYNASLVNDAALPTWLSFDANSGTFTGTPTNGDVGILAVKVTATDSGSLQASDQFTLTVTNVNDAPTVANPIADQSAQSGSAFSVAVPANTFSDIDPGDTLTYAATLADGSALPAWLSFDTGTRTFSGTPGSGDAGVLNLRVRATDTGVLSVADDFMLTVSSADQTLTGTAGNDVLTGGVGNDQLFGLTGNDTLVGGAGNDLLDGGPGTDNMQGGSRDDTYVVDNSGDVVTENTNEGTDAVQSSITYTLGANVENLTLTGSTNIKGTGNALDNVLVGNNGNNTITGGTGNDRLDGSLGNDTMIGGTGNDTFVVSQTGDVVTESANQGIDTVESAVTYNLGSNVENLTLTGTANINGTGGSANNVLLGNSGNNQLDGGSGNDQVDGGAGNDALQGGSGEDSLAGGLGDDMLTGGSDDDVLDGGDGLDSLDGGSGDDVLLGGAGNDGLTGGSGADQFTGGIGNDSLVGGSGNDSYAFARGDGQDTILDSDPFQGNQDHLLFGTTINPLDLVISRQANDLRLVVHGSNDAITIRNWYASPTTNQIEDIQAGNGLHLVNTQVDQLIQAMAGFSQQSGLTWDQAVEGRPQQVQAVLAANWH